MHKNVAGCAPSVAVGDLRRHVRWRLLARLAAVGLSTVGALLLGELGVRLFRPQLMFPRYVTDGGFGIRVNAAGAHYWHTSPEVHVEFRINSMGIRSDREYTLEKPAGTIRIVGLGDSFTQGYEVDLQQTYLYRLEETLREKGYPLEVINLGVSGHSTAEELIMLREFGFRFDPDVVIVGYFQNDLKDNIRSNLFRLNERDELVRAADAYLPAIGIRDRLYSFRAYRWLAENSQLFSLMRERVAGLVKRRIVEANMSQIGAGKDDGYAARLGARLLDEIRRDCAGRGVGFILLDIPGDCLSPSNLPVEHLRSTRPDEIVRTGPRLRAEGPDAYLYRRRGHFHWTPRGHEIAAELLAERAIAVLGEGLGSDQDRGSGRSVPGRSSSGPPRSAQIVSSETGPV